MDGGGPATGTDGLRPFVVDGEFVVVSVTEELAGHGACAMVREDEGLTYVLARCDADRLGLAYDYVAAWITLGLASSLDDVGLTAAVSQALAARGVSCNVLAGLHHDHLLVEHACAARALEVLGVPGVARRDGRGRQDGALRVRAPRGARGSYACRRGGARTRGRPGCRATRW